MSSVTCIPMSENQRGLWLLQTMNPELIAYNLASVFRAQGTLDVAALHDALKRVVRGHPILRTTFAVLDETPVQCVHADLAPQFEHVDVAGIAEDILQSQVQAAHDRPFNLTVGPLVRLTVFSRALNEHIVLFNWHHILLDFRSLAIITQEILDAYQIETGTQEPASHPEEAASYADFVAWQQNFLTGKGGKRTQQYWTEQLRASLPILNLPTDHPYPAQQTYNGHSLPICLPAALSQRIFAMAKQEEVTPFVLLLAAYTLLLARYSGQNDLIIGITTDERIRAPQRFRQTLGYMVNLIPMRLGMSADASFRNLLRHTETVVMGGLFHQNYPFARIVQDAQVERDLSRSPLFDVSFNMPVIDTDEAFGKLINWVPDHSNGGRALSVNGLQIAPYPIRHQEAQVPLHLDLWQQGEQLVGYFKYNTDLFDEATIASMASHFAVLLNSIVADLPDHTLLQLPMLTDAEYHQIVHQWNDTAVRIQPQTIHAMFEQQVERTPDDVALIFEDQQLTYRELNARTNQLAHHLIELGVQPDTLVAVAMERSIEMVVGLLAVLKAGGAYVPIDPTYPSERIRYMLRHSAAPIVLTQSDLSQRAPWVLDHESGHVTACPLGIAVDRAQLDTQSTQNPSDQRSQASCDQLAYVIYTSGSTGQPKGIAISHHNVANFLSAMELRPGLIKGDRLLALTTISFDIAVLELFLPLVVGASVVIASGDDTTDPQALIRLIQQHQITVAQATPATWTMLTSHPDWQSTPPLKVLCGGEALPLQLTQKLLENAQSVWNMYGPTEATVWVSVGRLEKGLRRVTIAPPIANTTFYILDDGGHVVPIGVGGELHIGGDNLARGYLNRPDLTSERFIEHPEFGRLYKTGDLCRWLSSGNIEFMGRTDFQVKIRGFRIELGEIENVLLALPGVREAVVLARENNALRGDKRLVAYFVPKGCSAIGDADSDTLQQYLAQRLPDYMVPSAFVKLKAMPLTPNGKLDRRALPAPDYALTQTAFVAPRNAFELKLADIWAGVLGVDKVGIHDNFFALGGHSLLATQVISRVRAQLNLEVPLKTLFETPQLAAFAEAISQTQTSSTAVIRKAPRRGQLPLSFAQQRLWFLDKLEQGSALYNIPMMIRLEGQLDVVALERSFAYLISRHESLRTTFGVIDGEPIQLIHDPTAFTLSLAVVDDVAQAQSRAAICAQTPFNLREGPLLRVQLLKIGENEHFLLLNMHHIISDGWSIGLLMEELSHAYTAYVQGHVPTLPELPIQYADFAIWQREHLSGGTLDEQLSFWREHLAGAPARLELPTDRPRPPAQSYQGAHYSFKLNRDLTDELNKLGQTYEATLFMVVLAAFNVLLSRYSDQTDIVVGTPIANRNRAEIEGLIGFFVNTLVLRTELEDNPTFTALLGRVRQTTLAAYEHQELPFEQLVDELQLERTLSYSPLFQVMLVFQNADEMGEFSLINLADNLTGTMQAADFPFAKFDLTLNLLERDEGLIGWLEYATDLFDEATIARMASHFTVLLEGIVEHPEQPVLQLPMLTDAEYHQIVHQWNDTTVDFGEPQTIYTLFEQQVERTPEAVALVFKESPKHALARQLTYRELNARANQLAHHLIELGVGHTADTLVAVAMDRSLEMVVALLAVLKAGGAYVPIDPTYPDARIRYMLTDSAAPILLTQSHLESIVPWSTEHVVIVDRVGAQLPTHNPESRALPEHLAYVIYTSGSTGQPKGVMVEHQALTSHIVNVSTLIDITRQDRVLQFSALSFDAAQEQLLTALCNGAALILRGNDIWTPEVFQQQVTMQGITVADLPPAYFQQLLTIWAKERPVFLEQHPLRLILLGGEKVQPQIVRSFRQLSVPSTRLLNVYGPTEATVTATLFDLTDYQLKSMPTNLPIGKPLPGRKAYILDQHGLPVPVGVFGELYIGGNSLAQGYLNRPELTAERFIEHPEFGRLYKTGDLCRYLPDGNACAATEGSTGSIEFMGRTDFQVKIRGFRIELGEIEAHLAEHPDVREAVVILNTDGTDKRLVAYLVTKSLSVGTMRAYLKEKVPDYMIPAAFVQLDALPLTPNGKVDRRALPAPDGLSIALSDGFVAPRNSTEQQLAHIWQDVLQIHTVDVRDNFFDSGGHSLLAVRLMAQIQQQFGLNLPLATLFGSPTIEQLATLLAEPAVALPWSSLVSIRSKGEKLPFFAVPGTGGNVIYFYELARLMGAGQPFYGLQAVGLDGESEPYTTISEMAAHYVAAIQTVQPQGPYLLGGHSLGGQVAFEMAQQLLKAGHEVARVVILDMDAPTEHSEKLASWDDAKWLAVMADFFSQMVGQTHRLSYEALQPLSRYEQLIRFKQELEQMNFLPAGSDIKQTRGWVQVFKANSRLTNYLPREVIPTRITLFRAEEGKESKATEKDKQQQEPTWGWNQFAEEPVEVVYVPGNHLTMMAQPHIQVLAKRLVACLAKESRDL